MTMNRFQLCFLRLLLSFAALRISSAVNEKPGNCPEERYVENNYIPKNFCQNDSDCGGDQKCCKDNGYKICKPPDNGTCCSTYVSVSSPNRRTDMCTTDSECAPGTTCCVGKGGYNCGPSIGDKAGFCALERIYPCFAPERSFCDSDTGCPGTQKCCSDGCANVCQEALAERSGECPSMASESESDAPSDKKDLCNSDYDCDSPKKCCDTGSGATCTDPSNDNK
ncbi:WAP four-disulfide core domain protein 3 [Anomaloglossus baeobatrachus]|uniref:WAP four-disulfide core domain protein 3 n=1 Tax=Anomaloglossus baeobatrachus TaxID=238106 RepID=UPI003F507C6C